MEEAWTDYEKTWKDLKKHPRGGKASSKLQTQHLRTCLANLGYSGYTATHLSWLFDVWICVMCDPSMEERHKTHGEKKRWQPWATRGGNPTAIQASGGRAFSDEGEIWRALPTHRKHIENTSPSASNPRCESTTRKNPCHQPFLTIVVQTSESTASKQLLAWKMRLACRATKLKPLILDCRQVSPECFGTLVQGSGWTSQMYYINTLSAQIMLYMHRSIHDHMQNFGRCWFIDAFPGSFVSSLWGSKL